MPEVSVVIPSYNHAPFIPTAVESVLNQTVADLELIVVDDGSSDNSLEVLAQFTDPRLKIISQANQGAHAAINCGLRLATAPALAILNSDDAFHPDRLEKAMEVLQADPKVGLVASHIEIMDTEGRKLGVKHAYQDCEPWLLPAPERTFRAGQDLRAALLTENYLATTSNYVISRNWLQQVGEFRPLRYAHDWDFALRMAHAARLALLPEPLVRYRVHAHNTIRENQAAMIFEICWILAVHLPQHLADRPFFEAESLETRIEQLLHSIYTYDLDRVLNVFLLLRLHEEPELALRLLDPHDPTRAHFLDFIQAHLAAQEAQAGGQAAAPAPTAAPGVLGKVKNRVKSLIR